MATATNTSPSEDLTNVVVEPHGMRHVSMQHLDFRRRFLDKYGRCCSNAIDIKAVECTCKAIANLTGESTDEIAVVYGINIVKFQSIADLAVDIVNNCYMDAALDATKRLSTCIDIYYKNKDASLDHGGSGGDGEDGEDKVVISFTQNTSLEYNIENVLSPIVFSGDVTGSLDVTITPRNCNLSGFATDSNQKVPADMVYELPVHTLADINIELATLKCTPISLENVSIEFRVNGVLTKTISLQVRDTSSLEVTMEESTVTVNKEGVVNPIIFTGELTKTIEVVVIPRNCSVSGFTSRPETVVSSGSSWSFNADTVQAINNELVALKILAPAEGKCQLEVHYLDDVTTFDIIVTPAEPSAQITFSLEDTTIILGQKTSIPAIIATGNITDAVTFKVTPSHCAISGFASDPDKVFCANAAYSFVAADITSINNELANLQVLGSTVGTALLKISYLNQEQTLNITVKPVPINVVVPTLDTCESLNELVESQIKPIVFKGKVEKDSVKVVITPMNCTFKGVVSNTETVYTNDIPCTFVGNSLENLNTEFAKLKVTPLQTQNVLLNITIDDEPTNYQFSFLVIPKKYTTLSVSLNTRTQMNVNRWTEIPVVFSGEIIEDDLRQITISPKNCTLKGMKTNNQETTEPYSFTPVSIKIANEELAKLQIMPLSESETSISIQIENEESQEFIFSNIQPAPKTKLNLSIDDDVELKVARETIVPLTFTGTVEPDDIRTVTVTPSECEIKTTGELSTSPISVEASTLEVLNDGFSNLTIKPSTQSATLSIDTEEPPIEIGGESPETIIQFNNIGPRPLTMLVPSISTDTTLTEARPTNVDMSFSGSIEFDDIRQITITPTNTKMTISDKNYENASPLVIDTYTELTDLNDQVKNMSLTPASTSDVKLTVAIENESPKDFVFETVNPRPHTTLTVDMNDSVELTSHRVTENQQMTFTGTIESDDPVTVTIQPTKCKLNINGTEVNDGSTHEILISGSDTVDQINEKVNDIDITPLDTSGVTISIIGNSSVLPEVKAVEHTVTFTTINPRPQTKLTVTCDNTENSIQAQVASNIAIVLAGTIETDDLRSLTLTPNNCSFTNINDTDTVYTHESPFTVEVFDIGTINSQLDNISLTATNTSDVTITATINKVDEPTVFTFTNVTPAPVSNISAVTTATESFNQSEETQNVQITVEGNFYTWDSKTVTVTPSGCTFTNVTDDDTSGTYTNIAPLTIENVTNISNINNKLNNLSVTVTELNASITVAIADGDSQQVTLTVIPAVSISLGEYTPVNWGEYTTATTMTIGGHSLESAEVFPEVKITPTNCRFKGVTDSSETEYTNDSPYTVTATNLEELNGKLNAIQILTFGNSPKIEIESEGHTNSIEINSIEKDHELTVSCESLDSALTNGTESSAMALVFDGTFVIGKTVTVKITPNNCSFKGVTGDLETVYTNESPLTITATESVSELNSKVNTITVTPLNTTDVKLTVLIDDTPTELTFTNVSPA